MLPLGIALSAEVKNFPELLNSSVAPSGRKLLELLIRNRKNEINFVATCPTRWETAQFYAIRKSAKRTGKKSPDSALGEFLTFTDSFRFDKFRRFEKFLAKMI